MAVPKLQLLSRTQYDADGATLVWDFNFSGGYLLPEHVKAYHDSPGGIRTQVAVTPSMLIGEFQLQIIPAVPAGNVLTIYRATPKDQPMVDFVDRGTVSEVALDTIARQAIFVAAEASDDTAVANVDVAVEAANRAFLAAESATTDAVNAATSAASSAASAITSTAAAATEVNLLRTQLSSALGAGYSGWSQAGTGAVPRTVLVKLRERVSVADFGAVGDGIADDTLPISAAAAFIRLMGGGTLYIGRGKHRTTQPISFEGVSKVTGDGSYSRLATAYNVGVSSIWADHNGSSVVTLKGASHVVLEDFAIEARQTDAPKTGLVLGRNSSASAGNHNLRSLSIRGNFKVSCIYSIASEENYYEHVSAWLYSESTGFATYYTAEEDTFAVESLVTSTNITGHFHACSFINSAFDDADPLRPPSVVYIDAKGQTGGFTFNACYLVPNSGAYITIRNAGAPDANILGPFTFTGVNGERLGVDGDPSSGVRIISATTVTVRGLNIMGSRFNFLSGTTKKAFFADPNVFLYNPMVVINPEEAFPYAVIDVNYGQIQGGIFAVGREGWWKPISLAGGWVNEFGSPYQQAEYKVTPTGEVMLRGEISGAAGVMFTLPPEARPKALTRVMAFNSTGVSLITVSHTTGTVTLSSASASGVSLNSIRFSRG